MQMHPEQPTQASSDAIAAEIRRLANMPLPALRAAWQAEFRKVPPAGLWRDLLLRTLAWRLQTKAFGGHDRAIERLLREHGRHKGEAKLTQRLKTGTVLIRDFGGV